MKSEKFPFQLFLATLKIALAAYTLRQNSCKTLLPQKNSCDGPFILQFKFQNTQMKTENKDGLKWWRSFSIFI